MASDSSVSPSPQGDIGLCQPLQYRLVGRWGTVQDIHPFPSGQGAWIPPVLERRTRLSMPSNTNDYLVTSRTNATTTVARPMAPEDDHDRFRREH